MSTAEDFQRGHPTDDYGRGWNEGIDRVWPQVERLHAALIECATISGADVSGGVPTWPDVDVWAVQEVQRLRDDYDDPDNT